MRTTLAIGMVLWVLTMAGAATASSLAELSATMGTENALSSGAASGASTAHAAMDAVLRNIPKPGAALPGADLAPGQGSHGSSGSSGWVAAGSASQGSGRSWATVSSSSGGRGGWMTARSSSNSNVGWATAASSHQSSGASTWARRSDAGGARRR